VIRFGERASFFASFAIPQVKVFPLRGEAALDERSEAYGPKGRLRGEAARVSGSRAYFRGNFSGQFAAYHANTAATAPCCFNSSGCT
jgi:hypothetical protein